MNITSIYYLFHNNEVVVKIPFKIERETEKCYFTKDSRYLKEEIGKPMMKYPASYPYIELVMVDANEEVLREELSKWFTNKAYQVWKITD